MFLNYIHYKTNDSVAARLENYVPRTNKTVPIPISDSGEIYLQAIDAEAAFSNVSALVSENYTVVIVREKYAHICPIT
jgi:hypothetical protein